MTLNDDEVVSETQVVHSDEGMDAPGQNID